MAQIVVVSLPYFAVQHSHCAQSKDGTTLHCVLLRLSAEQVGPKELRAAISELVLIRQARVARYPSRRNGRASAARARTAKDL
jgi:hypothetical protein